MPAVYGFGKSGLGRELHLSRRHLRLLLAMPKNIKNNLGPTTYYDDTHTHIFYYVYVCILYIYNYSLPLFSLSLSHCAKGQYLAAVHRSALRTRLIGIQKVISLGNRAASALLYGYVRRPEGPPVPRLRFPALAKD